MEHPHQPGASAPAGAIIIRFANVGQEAHHDQFVRLPDDFSLDSFAAALQHNERAPRRAAPLVRQAGNAAAVAPGLTMEVGLTLEAGNYAFICVIPSPADRVRHVAKGMSRRAW